MAIYAIGAYDDSDVSPQFISANIAGLIWEESDAPELHQFIKTLKVGDLVYIKSFSPSSSYIEVKAIGVICDNVIVGGNDIVSIGRNIKWVIVDSFKIEKQKEKNNVRLNTMYEEFHPIVQREILDKLFNK